MSEKGRYSKAYMGQWTGQFYTAAELVRRGYLVGLIAGNAEEKDLLVESPNGASFSVDVKGGVSGNTFFPIRLREPKPDLYFIIVYAPRRKHEETGEWMFATPRFYIISSMDAMNLMRGNQKEWWATKSPEIHEKYRAKYGEDYRNAWAGLDIRRLEEGRWDKLPR